MQNRRVDLTFSALENAALGKLMTGPCARAELHDYLSAKKHVSRAGFYKVLASLKKREVVVEANGTLSISKLWLADAQSFFRELSRQKAVPSYLAREVAALGPEDRITYDFSSMAEIDIFLLNLMLDLSALLSEHRVLIREPHEFFVVADPARTGKILKEFKKAGRSILLLIESDSGADSDIVKSYLAEPAQGYRIPRRASADARKITSIVGDVIVELRMAKRFTAELEGIFKKEDSLSPRLRDAIRELAARKDRHVVSIYRDASKASALGKVFKKYFVLA